MPIYLLKRNDRVGYDECAAKVIRATGESPARTIASRNPGDEGSDVWLDPIKVTASVIDPRGKAEEILGSHRDG